MSFRLRILVAMTLLVAGITGATLLVTQRIVEATYSTLFESRLDREVGLLTNLQDARLGAVKAKGRDLAESVRLLAAFEERDADLLYRIALDELRDVLGPPGGPGARPAAFFRLIDATGRVLPPEDQRAGLVGVSGGSGWEAALSRAGQTLAAGDQAVGYLTPEVDGHAQLVEVVLTPVVDGTTGRRLGTLVVGFPLREAGAAPDGSAPVRGGLVVDGRLYGDAIPAALRPDLAAAATQPALGARVVDVDGTPHRLAVRPIATAAALPAAFHLALYPIADMLAAERRLRRTVLAFGGAALILAVLLSARVAGSLSEPVERLVAATAEVQEGNLAVTVPVHGHDELARLGIAFNAMVGDLALKERYRSVLDLVADRGVARQLLSGDVTLGGELRDATVLFADICGFTALTEHLEPSAVIQLLNEHMTALTRVVHAHGGVVDKFVGDSLMAIFGAPTNQPDDARRAVRAARGIVAARAELNVRTGRPIAISIGIGSGMMVAGCMGSADRLNYTVLGERVNLAARLCAEAGPMEILIDETTRARLGTAIAVEARSGLRLKGFSRLVLAYRVVTDASVATA